MRSYSKQFGKKLRSAREKKGLGLRELAKQAKISPAFLSKIERGEEKPPAEKKLRSLAKVLDYDPDVLLAISGRLPSDVMNIIKRHPHEYIALLRDLRARSAAELKQVRAFTQIEFPLTPELARLVTKGEIVQYEWEGSKEDPKGLLRKVGRRQAGEGRL